MSPQNLSLAPPERIPELDGLRGIAVLMVLAWHFVGVMVDPGAAPWEFAAYHALRLGRTGVDLFFVLSGFLITGIVLDRRRPARQFLSSFYLRRSLRILPPYFALVGIFWLLVAAGLSIRGVNDQTPIWYHLTLTQNWWMAAHQTFGPDALSVTWSVAIEEQYYLLAPLVLLCLPKRYIPAFLVLIAVASALFRAWIYSGPTTVISAYILTPSRLDGLAVGGLLAWSWRHPAARAWLGARARALACLTVVGLIGMAGLAAMMMRDLAWHMFSWGHTYLALLSVLVIACALLHTGSAAMRPLRHPPLRFIGSISYSLYLFHPCIFGAAILLFGHKPVAGEWRDWLMVLGALAVSFAVCAASMALVEARLISYGRRFRY